MVQGIALIATLSWLADALICVGGHDVQGAKLAIIAAGVAWLLAERM